jgi:hypothetical protein
MTARLDGNAIGGVMLELFGVEMTLAATVCGSCGAERPLAELHVYLGAGAVARCASCGQVMLRVVRAPSRLWLDLRGTASLEVGSRP